MSTQGCRWSKETKFCQRSLWTAPNFVIELTYSRYNFTNLRLIKGIHEFFHLQTIYFRKLDFCVCFKGFTGTTYANFQGTKNTVVSLFIFFILPYFTCHPSLYCVIALLLQAASFFILPWLPTTGGLISEDIFNFDPTL